MASNEGDGTLYVPFAPGLVRAHGQRASALLSMGAFFWFGGWAVVRAMPLPSSLNPGNAAAQTRMLLLAVVLVVLGPLFVLLGLYSLLIYLERRDDRKPALAIGPKGVLWGCGLGRPFFLPWSELASVGLDEGYPGDEAPMAVRFVPKNALVSKARIGKARWCFATTSGVPVVRPSSLAAPWREISAALDRFATFDAPPSKTDGPAREAHPETLDEFWERFREAPLGVWTTIEWSSSPGDSTAWFRSDGTGGVSSGAAGFMGHSDAIEWRKRDDWSIDVRLEGEEPWIAYDYSFSERDGEIRICFEEAEFDAENWTRGLSLESFSYGGPCRQDVGG